MSRSQRDKGRQAELEVRRIYEAHGFVVRGLEGTGDHLAVGHGLTIHSEVKRQEVLRLPLWTRQALAEAPDGTLPIVAYRRNREEWQALVLLPEVGARFARRGMAAGVHYSLHALNEEWWARLSLDWLLGVLSGGWKAAQEREAS